MMVLHICLLHLHIVLLSRLFVFVRTLILYDIFVEHSFYFHLGNQSVSNKASVAALRLYNYFLMIDIVAIGMMMI